MRDFLHTLWHQPVPGDFTVWLAPSRDSIHDSLISVLGSTDGGAVKLHQINEREDVYFGLGLREPGLPQHRQGGKQDIVALPAFALDIDKADPLAHKATNLPVTDDDVMWVLDVAPPPSIVINSGHGYHFYWVFDEPLMLASASDRASAQVKYAAFQSQFIRRAKERDWHVDSTATIQRVWRLPGFKNHKKSKIVGGEGDVA